MLKKIKFLIIALHLCVEVCTNMIIMLYLIIIYFKYFNLVSKISNLKKKGSVKSAL